MQFFRVANAVHCTPGFLGEVRSNLDSEIRDLMTLNCASESLTQLNVLNLIYVLLANIDCMQACKLQFSEVVPEAELTAFKTLTIR